MRQHNACLIEYAIPDSQYAHCLMLRVYPKPQLVNNIIPFRAAQIIGDGLVKQGFKLAEDTTESDIRRLWFCQTEKEQHLNGKRQPLKSSDYVKPWYREFERWNRRCRDEDWFHRMYVDGRLP